MKSRDLQSTWREWLAVGERLRLTLHEQTVAVTLRDVGRVERLQPQLEQLMGQLAELDRRALEAARVLAESLGVSPRLRDVVRALEKLEGQQVQLLANKVTAISQDIQSVVAKNRRLIESEMTFINGTLTLIAKAATPANSPYSTRTQSAILVDHAA